MKVLRNSLEWHRMWKAIDETFGDMECLDPATGAKWEYMGTVEIDDDIVHQFRHRAYRGKVEWIAESEETAP